MHIDIAKDLTKPLSKEELEFKLHAYIFIYVHIHSRACTYIFIKKYVLIYAYRYCQRSD
jgi:hypothetical protein